MTDRIKALTVYLERDIREDDVQHLLGAVRMLRGVLEVETHVSNIDERLAELRATTALQKKLWEVLKHE